MSGLVLNGDTSGSISIVVPAVAGSNTVTVPAGTGTFALQGVSTNIVSGTAVASTSGTSIDFTGIPSWVKRITVMFNGVSTNGASAVILQVGAGSIATSGYQSLGGAFASATPAAITSTTYFAMEAGSVSGAASARYGQIILSSFGSNNWSCNGGYGMPSVALCSAAGSVALGGTLDRVRITTVNGTDTFDAGSINILYE